MRISVIIPVYNAEKYVREAVESTLKEPEVAEVILVEDGSPDGSLKQCELLQEEYGRVKLFRHPGGENMGAGASRDLGISKSSFDLIAFLDADDFYLPNRFTVAKKKIDEDSKVEGVYEAIGFHFEDEVLEKKHTPKGKSNLTTMSEVVDPEELFFKMSPIGSKGYFSVNGLLIKKSVIEKTGGFPNLSLHQDTVLLVKLAAISKLFPGKLDSPVAMRRVHGENRIIAKRTEKESYSHRIKMWLTIYRWARTNLDKEKKRILLYKTIKCSFSHHLKSSKQIKLRDIIKSCWRLLLLFLSNPFLLLDLHLVRIKDIRQGLNKL